jgi:hypothetical protein
LEEELHRRKDGTAQISSEKNTEQREEKGTQSEVHITYEDRHQARPRCNDKRERAGSTSTGCLRPGFARCKRNNSPKQSRESEVKAHKIRE